MSDNLAETTLSSKKAAKRLHMGQGTVNRMVRTGKLKAVCVHVGKQRHNRISIASIDAYLKDHPFAEPPESGKKKCNSCKQIKFLDAFHNRTVNKDGKMNTCIQCKARMGATQREKHPEQRRNSILKHKFGITLEEYQQMSLAQNDVCAICKQPESRVHATKGIHDLCVDHCHITGAVRGLLCSRCNSALGQINEDPETAKALLAYIEERVLY